ncbi:MAG: iron chelate uptake ABC transporter family permease subunit, partial [Limnochordales bacterium]
AIAGTIMQQLTRNKFVSPTTAGTMDAARLGVLAGLLVFPGASLLQKTAVAFAFALAGTYVFIRIVERVKIKNTIFIPLVGLMFGNIVSSVTTSVAYRFDLLQSLATWLHGDFSMILRGRYEMLYVGVPLMAVAYVYADRFTIAGMGDSFAANLGLNYRRVVNVGLFIVAAVSSAVVLTVGSLPFLGLVVPNIVTIYRGDNVRKNLPHTALLGAALVVGCDVIGRIIIHPYEVSVGLIMGVLGSAVFLFLLLRGNARGARGGVGA